MKKIHVKLTFTEPVLGTSPANEDIYRDYVATKAVPPLNQKLVDDEVAALTTDELVKKGKTIFPRMEDGTPFLYDYQVKGFFKGACSALRKAPEYKSSKLAGHKKEIDLRIFVEPRKIPFSFEGEIGECQRPLRTSGPQGERNSLAISDEIPAGATIEFTVTCLLDSSAALVKEWLDYGAWSGIGQWRNSGKGRFTWEEIEGEEEEVKPKKKKKASADKEDKKSEE